MNANTNISYNHPPEGGVDDNGWQYESSNN